MFFDVYINKNDYSPSINTITTLTNGRNVDIVSNTTLNSDYNSLQSQKAGGRANGLNADISATTTATLANGRNVDINNSTLNSNGNLLQYRSRGGNLNNSINISSNSSSNNASTTSLNSNYNLLSS